MCPLLTVPKFPAPLFCRLHSSHSGLEKHLYPAVTPMTLLLPPILDGILPPTALPLLLSCVFKVSLCSPGWPGSHCIDQAGLKLKRSDCLCLPSAGIKGVHHHTQPSPFSLVHVSFWIISTMRKEVMSARCLILSSRNAWSIVRVSWIFTELWLNVLHDSYVYFYSVGLLHTLPIKSGAVWHLLVLTILLISGQYSPPSFMFREYFTYSLA